MSRKTILSSSCMKRLLYLAFALIPAIIYLMLVAIDFDVGSHDDIISNKLNSNMNNISTTSSSPTSSPILSILNDTQRIKYYMGKWYHNNVTFLNNNWTIFQNKYLHPHINYYSIFNDTKNRQRFTEKEVQKIGKHQIYTKPFWDFLNSSSKSQDFKCKQNDVDAIVVTGDSPDHEKYDFIPAFAKSRFIYKHNLYNNIAILIQEMEYRRHWGYPCHLAKDTEWDKKRNIVIWRGATTNGEARRSFVEQYINYNVSQTGIDVGFTLLVQIKPPDTIESLKRLQKNTMTPIELLKYKYLVSIEGNDVASNLNWLLMSNSVVFMKTPSKESWLMEGLLKPYIHYIPLSVNRTNGTLIWNLEQQYKFCLNNDNLCHQIAQNGKRFIIENKFCDRNHEKKLQQQILDIYCMRNHMNFTN